VKLTLEFEQKIHARLLTRDPTALSDLAEACANELRAWLRRTKPNVRDPNLYDDAAADAILNYGEHPERYNPSLSRLSSYLCTSARGDLLNLLKRESGRQLKEISFANIVENEDSDRNEIGGEPFRPFRGRNEEEDGLLRTIGSEKGRKEFLAHAPESEIAAVREWLDGTRDTATFVALLGLGDLVKDKQEDAVKRFKDKYTQQLKRWAAKKRKTNERQ
jgi:hypothetical protein